MTYEGCLESTSNHSLLVGGGGSATTLIQMNAEGQTVSKPSNIKVHRRLVDFLCLGKIVAAIENPAQCVYFYTGFTANTTQWQLSIVKFSMCMDPITPTTDCY